jgi:hypothetical protein
MTRLINTRLESPTDALSHPSVTQESSTDALSHPSATQESSFITSFYILLLQEITAGRRRGVERRRGLTGDLRRSKRCAFGHPSPPPSPASGARGGKTKRHKRLLSKRVCLSCSDWRGCWSGRFPSPAKNRSGRARYPRVCAANEGCLAFRPLTQRERGQG